MIFQVRHATKYHYEHRVDHAAHLLHLRPLALPWQDVQSFAIRSSAATGRWSETTDYFGNPTAHLRLPDAHDALEIVADLIVLMHNRPQAPEPAATQPWEHVAAEAQRRSDIAEFAFASPMTPAKPQLRAWVRASFPPGRPILAGVTSLIARTEHRTGTCVTSTHRLLACLRTLGLPCRFVSGYVRTEPPPGTARLRGADLLHAWVACWLGPDWGWIDLDPVTGQAPGDGNVWLACGRDYADVAPIRGVLCGGGRHTMSVSVDIERQIVLQTPHPVPIALAQ